MRAPEVCSGARFTQVVLERVRAWRARLYDLLAVWSMDDRRQLWEALV